MPSLRKVLSVVLALAALACSRGNTLPAAKASEASKVAAAPDTTDARVRRADLARITGDSAAPVWFVMASDFQCPYCKMWHDTTWATIARDYIGTGKIRVAYVNFPIPSHMNAVPSAEAAMCAGAQGKFWEYGDQLFATQQEWAAQATPQPTYQRLAKTMGLDSAAFAKCLDDHVMVPMIQADRQRGKNSGVTGTPYFFIGKHVIDMAKPTAAFKAVIDSALAEARNGVR
jgi:protein-disulfide isomerase